MHTFSTLVSLALLLAARLVNAGVYVTNPVQASSCAGDESCQVEWVDDGQAPLLANIGECQVGLYTGNYQLVQSLQSVDVSTTSSFTFTPNPSVGPNGAYYLVFSSSNSNYQSFSGSFTLTGMSGTVPSGSSVPATAPGSTSTGSSTSAGSTVSGTPTDTATTPSGTSASAVSTSDSTIASGSTTAPSSTLTTPTTTGSSTTTSSSTTTTTSSSSSSSSSPSASATNAASRVGSSTSLGGIAALFVLSGILAF